MKVSNTTSTSEHLLVRYFCVLTFCFLFLTPFSLAAPPFQQSESVGGFLIRYPAEDIHKQWTPYKFDVHVVNVSNGVPITSGVVCILHLYGINGEHLAVLNDSDVSEHFDYDFTLDKNNFSAIGDYFVNVQCNSTTSGGFTTVPFKVTPSGFTGMLGFFVLLILLSYGVLAFGIYKGDVSIALLGTFGLYLLGLYMLFFGLDGQKDLYTNGFAVITLGTAFYVSAKAALEYFES